MDTPGQHKISSFSVLLIMIACAVVGIIAAGNLNVQYAPVTVPSSITVSYTYPGASSSIVETKVTSRLEGILSEIKSTSGTSSISSKGGGSVTVSFRKGTDMAAARFEVASQIRNIYTSLPDGVSYPSISLSTSGKTKSAAVVYILKGASEPEQIYRYANDCILGKLSAIKGVDRLDLSGAEPGMLVITFDADKSKIAGITAADIENAVNEHFGNEAIGMASTDKGRISVRLLSGATNDLDNIPVKNDGGRIYYLRDIAKCSYQESEPSAFYRVNGLNTITLSVFTAQNTNLIKVVSNVKKEMKVLQSSFPEGITASIGYDASDYMSKELGKNVFRTLLCLLILLLFVFLINRSWRYMLVIAVTLTVNILVSIAIYFFAGLQIHIYTLAGITVSLGIIIDTSIVMIDHYSYYGDRSVFLALVGAVTTTVAALLLVLLLPDSETVNLTDFIWVIAINLIVSLLIAYLFVPALMEYLPAKKTKYQKSARRCRRVLKWNMLYSRYIRFGLKHRWIPSICLVVLFGIPLCMIPESVEWRPYSENRDVIDRVAGTTFYMFYNSLNRANFYRESEPNVLRINAGMPEGCTVGQLNEIVKKMENYLSQFNEISLFTTDISSFDDARIEVFFKPEFEYSSFPFMLKSKVSSMAENYGGAYWRITGIDDKDYSNIVSDNSRSDAISLYGYNYMELAGYSDALIKYLSKYQRVVDPEVRGASLWGRPSQEFNIFYDFETLAALGTTPYSYYGKLSTLLYDSPVNEISYNGRMTKVVLRSSAADSYDLWNVLNSPVKSDSVKLSLSDVGRVDKRRTGIDIEKEDQSYKMNVCYNYIGNYALSQKVAKRAVSYMNSKVLPVGYKAELANQGWFDAHRGNYAWLVLLIIAVIYVMLSIIFDSLRYPFAVIIMIPVSFIGLFLAFGLSDFAFDQGGFAALVMLCGIVVNAGIYLITTYKTLSGNFADRKIHRKSINVYLKAYNHKINPIMLTIISTILGLLPFLSDGPKEVFWFDFAIGTISGLLFSLLALLFYLPVFALRKER